MSNLVTPTTSPSSANPSPEPLDRVIAREWANNAALRSSFADDMASFAAFKRAEAAGLVRIHSLRTSK